MKNTIRLLLILATLLQAQLCWAIGSTEKNPNTIVQFTNSLCKSIGHDPIITVCVSGEPGEGEFNEHHLKALKSKTRTLVKDYKKSNRVVNAKFSSTTCGSQCTQTDWDPMICGGTSYCAMYPADPACMPPPDPCAGPMGMMTPGCPGYIPPSTCTIADWNPTTCGGTSFCAVYPTDAACNPCTGGPSPACSTFCTAHPADPTCIMMYPPSACTIEDWDPATCGGTSFCAVYPTNSACITSLCTYYDWDPAFCGAATYCDAYPNTSPHCL